MTKRAPLRLYVPEPTGRPGCAPSPIANGPGTNGGVGPGPVTAPVICTVGAALLAVNVAQPFVV